MEAKIPSPREFMRQRRPERFSDSLPAEHSDLHRSVLEYHLDTLTSRSQESDFERFARAIVEYEICPNLLPHTGPTGGGDSKVDTETYPVSDQLALGWYYGIGRQASGERWAFAFSAKKDWRAKVRSDVEAIVRTGRAYKKIFFVTNQFVKDKDRSAVEDQLHKKHSVEVRILDRSWLVDCVLKQGRESIAIATLGVPTTIRREVRKGPRDIQREGQLEESDRRVSEALAAKGESIQLVEDALDSALTARSLDRPRVEVDGRFLRAYELANSFGTRHQKLRAVYEWAWATYWWFEDAGRFGELYGGVEALALGSESAYHLELLCNLWMCLNTAVSFHTLDTSAAKLGERTESLLHDLDRLSRDEGRLGNALHAKTLALQVRLLDDRSGASAIFAELKSVVERADNLANYPFQSIAQLVTELSAPLGHVDGYDDLFSVVVDISSRREGELTAARLLVKRGAQLLEQDKPYEAISRLGSALSRLYKDESRGNVVRALYMCGSAYSRVGLLWAARGALVNAASIATDATWTRGEVTRLQAACYSRISLLELELGRLPQALSWHEVASNVRAVIAERGEYAPGQREEQERLFDGALGLLFLQADLATLRLLESMPTALDRLGLFGSAIALMFSLGHDDQLPEEWKRSELTGKPEDSIFRKWRDQPAAAELRMPLSVGLEPSLAMESRILGCHIQVECENTSPCVELAESVLAAIESFLSTGLSHDVIALEPSLSIQVRRSEYADSPFSFRMVEDKGRPKVIIACRGFSPHSLSHEDQGALQGRLTEVLVTMFARAFFAGDLERTMTTLFGDERALERAVAFTRSFVTVGNVLGHSPRTAITDWVSREDKTYVLRRMEAWDEADRVARASRQRDEATARRTERKLAQDGEPPADLMEGRRSAKHTEIKTISLIRLTLWDQAIWCGVASMTTPGNVEPPVLGLVFENGGPATEIFQAWREELGAIDQYEQLYVAIVRGFSKRNPSAYRVLIGANPATALGEPDAKYAVMTYRIHTMEPTSPENLDRFVASYAAVGRYVLAPGVVVDKESFPRIGLHLSIEKRILHVRPAWQVGRHDLEAAAIDADDDPIIPSGQTEVPVAPVLALMRERKAAERGD